METIEIFATKGIEYLIAIGFLILFTVFWRLPIPRLASVARRARSGGKGEDAMMLFSGANGNGEGTMQKADMATKGMVGAKAATGILAKTVQVLLVTFLVAPIVLFVVLLPILLVVNMLTG